MTMVRFGETGVPESARLMTMVRFGETGVPES